MSKSNIYIPERLVVGYREKKDTYTGKLAYIIYYDGKNVLRKERSWQSWRDEAINSQEFKNEPTSGFVLNKKAGGYSTGWNHRQTYTRVYDPRGFEFEITVPNLLYILENTDCLKGKGLQGEFVYGWGGSDLILIPTDSPDYAALKEFTDRVDNARFKQKDMIPGATYQTKTSNQIIYLGRFDAWEEFYSSAENVQKCVGKRYFFYDAGDWRKFHTRTSLSSILQCVNDVPVDNYAELMDTLQTKAIFSPVALDKDEYVQVTPESIEGLSYLRMYFTYEGVRWLLCIYADKLDKLEGGSGYDWNFTRNREMAYHSYWRDPQYERLKQRAKQCKTREDFFKMAIEFGFKLRRRYLANGKIYSY